MCSSTQSWSILSIRGSMWPVIQLTVMSTSMQINSSIGRSSGRRRPIGRSYESTSTEVPYKRITSGKFMALSIYSVILAAYSRSSWSSLVASSCPFPNIIISCRQRSVFSWQDQMILHYSKTRGEETVIKKTIKKC